MRFEKGSLAALGVAAVTLAWKALAKALAKAFIMANGAKEDPEASAKALAKAILGPGLFRVRGA